MQTVTTEKGYQKYAWTLLAIDGIAALLIGLMALFGVVYDETPFQYHMGQSWAAFSAADPNAASLYLGTFAAEGAVLSVLGVLTIAIAYTAFKKGERWAWYVAWLAPLLSLYLLVVHYMIGSFMWMPDALFLILALAAISLPYRKFFPKK